jgi:hypothetical protein
MGFYYISIFSLIPLAIAYGLLALVFWGLTRITREMRGRKAVLVAVGAVFLVLPVAEEVWIAWNFAQACGEAGTFIYKRVQVEGFYDDTRTTHAGPPTPQAVKSFEESGYQFLEMKGKEKFIRIEKTDGNWRAVVLDQPKARYHYRWPDPYGVRVAHKVGKSERLVIDTETNEQIARYTGFGRRPPWFWIGLDTPPFACDAPGRWPLARGNPLIYREALIPKRMDKGSP